ATYLSPVLVCLFFILDVGSLSSTADSDLAALSSIFMTDVYGKNLARGKPDPKTKLWVGRATMIVATALGIMFATLKLDILSMLVFVGALWGAIVFPVIVSLYWDRVDNRAFTLSVLAAFAMFVATRFQLVDLNGVMAVPLELLASIGGGVVIGLMAFGLLGKKAGLLLGAVTMVVLAPYAVGFLRDYPVLMSSLVAYGSSAVVCVGLSLRA